MLADQPRLFARHVLLAHVADPRGRAVGDADAHGGEARLEHTVGPSSQLTLRQDACARVFSAESDLTSGIVC